MASNGRSRTRRDDPPPLGLFMVGLGFGLLVAILTSVMPVVSIVLIAATLVAAPVALRTSTAAEAAFGSGLLVGSGAFLTLGAVNTLAACLDDRCGDGNPWPLLVFSLVCLGAGLLIARRSISSRT